MTTYMLVVLRWIAFAVLAASVGNVGWEYVVLPGVGWLAKSVLWLVNQGPTFVSDALYARAGLARIEGTIVMHVLFLSAAMVLSGWTFIEWRMRHWHARIDNRRRRWGPIQPVRSSKTEQTRLMKVRGILLMCVMTVVLQYVFFMSGAVMESRFQHRLSAISEFLTPADERQLLSRFARVRTEASYTEIMQQLDRVAAEHGIVWADGM